MTKLAYPVRRIVNFDGSSDTVHYIGEASFGIQNSDAAWRIFRLSYSGSDFQLRYADGTDEYNKVWDNRASYTY